jgi:pimeloyl-ACP methyl ester carboxylesterase
MQLHFRELGGPPPDALPLVMLHGLFGSSDNWLGVAHKIAQGLPAHVYALDLRNHGLSPHSDEMSFPAMAGDVAEFLDARGLDRIQLLGHSLGGKVAMQFALTFPDRVEKLVIVDIAPRPYAPEHLPIFNALLALDLRQFQSRSQIEEALAPEIPDLTLRRFLLKNLAHETDAAGTRVFKWRIPLAAIQANYPKLCEATVSPNPFRGPALFLHGGRSAYISEKDAPQIRQLFPMAKIETIARANHWVHADAPEEFVQRVTEFLGL